MSDDVSPAVEPPFDTVPAPAEEPEAPSEEMRAPRRRRPTVWLATIVVGVLVVGQSVAFVMLFGEKLERLSAEGGKETSSSPEAAASLPPGAPAAGAPKTGRSSRGRVPARPRHALDFGRESLEDGDLQAARVIAASFLLSIDGRADADRDRESEGLALLGRVLAREYAGQARGDER